MIQLLGDKISFYYRLKRKRKRITQRKLSELLGYSVQSISLWKKNKRRVPKECIPLLAKIFGISEKELLKETVQISGLKRYVNWSNVSIWEIEKGKEYPGLSEDEIDWAIEYRNSLNSL